MALLVHVVPELEPVHLVEHRLVEGERPSRAGDVTPLVAVEHELPAGRRRVHVDDRGCPDRSLREEGLGLGPVREAEIEELRPGLEVQSVELRGPQSRRAGQVDLRHLSREAGRLDGRVEQVAGERMLAQEAGDLPAEAGGDAEAADSPECLQERAAPLLRRLGARDRRRRGQLVARRRLGDEADLEVDQPVAQPGVELEQRPLESVDPARRGPLVGAGSIEKPALDGHRVSAFPRRGLPEGGSRGAFSQACVHGVARRPGASCVTAP